MLSMSRLSCSPPPSLSIRSEGGVLLVLVLVLVLVLLLVGARLLWKAGLGDPSSSCFPDLQAMFDKALGIIQV